LRYFLIGFLNLVKQTYFATSRCLAPFFTGWRPVHDIWPKDNWSNTTFRRTDIWSNATLDRVDTYKQHILMEFVRKLFEFSQKGRLIIQSKQVVIQCKNESKETHRHIWFIQYLMVIIYSIIYLVYAWSLYHSHWSVLKVIRNSSQIVNIWPGSFLSSTSSGS